MDDLLSVGLVTKPEMARCVCVRQLRAPSTRSADLPIKGRNVVLNSHAANELLSASL